MEQIKNKYNTIIETRIIEKDFDIVQIVLRYAKINIIGRNINETKYRL